VYVLKLEREVLLDKTAMQYRNRGFTINDFFYTNWVEKEVIEIVDEEIVGDQQVLLFELGKNST
jgi:hypothetical protein